MRVAAAGYGDIPFHMTQVSKFAYQKHLDFNEPIFDGERMRYAFFINLISGLILRFSNNWFIAMQVPVLILMASAIVLMFVFYRYFLKSNLGAVFAVFIFLFGSGFGANYLFQKVEFSALKIISTLIPYMMANNSSTITKWDAVFPAQNIDWGSPLSLVFLHQRAFILGFFMFTLFLYLLKKWTKDPSNHLLTLFLGIVVGISPLAHYHSFIAMLVILGFTAARTVIKNEKGLLLRLIFLGVIILVFSLPQIAYLMHGKNMFLFSDQSFIKFRVGWMVEETNGSAVFNPESGFIYGKLLPYLNFLWINFGVILPSFGIISFVALKSQKFKQTYPFVFFLALSAMTFFFLVQLIRFQPWDYDDNKILVYFQFFAAPVVVAFFMWVSKNMKIIGYLSFALFVLLATYSGIFDQIPRLLVAPENMPIIFSRDARVTAEYIRDNITADSRIITTSTHLNIVSSLSGKPVLVGYPGWLWTRGIDYISREQNLRQFYSNPVTYSNIADFYHAKYVLIEPTAVYDWKVNANMFNKNWDLLLDQGEYQLYRLH